MRIIIDSSTDRSRLDYMLRMFKAAGLTIYYKPRTPTRAGLKAVKAYKKASAA